MTGEYERLTLLLERLRNSEKYYVNELEIVRAEMRAIHDRLTHITQENTP